MALVEVRNIHKRFGANHVLNGVSLDIDEGEIVTSSRWCALENVDDEIRVGGEHVHAAMPGCGNSASAWASCSSSSTCFRT